MDAHSERTYCDSGMFIEVIAQYERVKKSGGYKILVIIKNDRGHVGLIFAGGNGVVATLFLLVAYRSDANIVYILKTFDVCAPAPSAEHAYSYYIVFHFTSFQKNCLFQLAYLLIKHIYRCINCFFVLVPHRSEISGGVALPYR